MFGLSTSLAQRIARARLLASHIAAASLGQGHETVGHLAYRYIAAAKAAGACRR